MSWIDDFGNPPVILYQFYHEQLSEPIKSDLGTFRVCGRGAELVLCDSLQPTRQEQSKRRDSPCAFDSDFERHL